MTNADNEYHKATNATIAGAVLSYVAGLFLLMSFCSPYWIESYPEMFSAFKNMGLWEYCFEQFRYPYYQFPKLFDGCHHVFSHEFYVIREWLLPGWLMFVQTCVTLAFIGSVCAQATLACVVVRWPLESVLRYEWMCTGFAFCCAAGASFLLFWAVVVFGFNAYRQDWLMYPAFNVLSWSYAFAVVAFMIFGLAALFLYFETKRSYEMRRESKNLVMQMQESQSPPVGFSSAPSSHRSGYI